MKLATQINENIFSLSNKELVGSMDQLRLKLKFMIKHLGNVTSILDMFKDKGSDVVKAGRHTASAKNLFEKSAQILKGKKALPSLKTKEAIEVIKNFIEADKELKAAAKIITKILPIFLVVEKKLIRELKLFNGFKDEYKVEIKKLTQVAKAVSKDENMKLSEQVLTSIAICEKLILINKNKKNGQVVFLAGGGGSGKGFVASNFVDFKTYKQFNVDDMKDRLLKINKLTGKFPELKGLDLRNPDDVFKLHKFVADRKLDQKAIDLFLGQTDKDKGLPNLLFDVTLKDIKKFNDLKPRLEKAGYKSKDMHIVWVLTDYAVAAKNNKSRDRVVPEDILLQTHIGAATTLSDLLVKKNPVNGMDGEVYVVLNNKEETVAFKDKNGKDLELFVPRKTSLEKGLPIVKGGKSDITKHSVESVVRVNNFSSLKLKDSGKAMDGKKLSQKLLSWIVDNVPEGSKEFISKK